MDKNIWNEFENCLKDAGEISFWWRDDDVRARKVKLFDFDYLKYTYRLEKLLKLLKKYDIPSIFAVIPKDFYAYGKKLVKILKKYPVLVTVHGINHVNNSKDARVVSEFPDGCDIDLNSKTIVEHKEKFEQIFGEKVLPVFVPPYNNMNKALETKLLDSGFTKVSVMNAIDKEHSDYNIDIDFVDWSEYRLKADEVILQEVIDAINRGIKVIGINSHHQRIKSKGFKFFDKFFKTTRKFDAVKWIIPFS